MFVPILNVSEFHLKSQESLTVVSDHHQVLSPKSKREFVAKSSGMNQRPFDATIKPNYYVPTNVS